VLDTIDSSLADTTLTTRQHISLVRACRTHAGHRAAEVLRRHIGHPVREVGLAALHALKSMPAATAEASEPWDERFLAGERDHAVHVLSALVCVRDDPSTPILQAALRDELALVTRRVFACLALRHGAADFDRIALQLSQHDLQSHAVALEWLDVSLPASARFVIALLDPALSDQERLRALGADPQPAHSKDEVMRDLIGDPESRWRRPWLQACAVHAAWDDPAYRPGTAAIAVERDRALTTDIVLETVESLQRRRPGGS